jgi:hypothetical protein
VNSQCKSATFPLVQGVWDPGANTDYLKSPVLVVGVLVLTCPVIGQDDLDSKAKVILKVLTAVAFQEAA